MPPKKKAPGWSELEPEELCLVDVTTLKDFADAKKLIVRLKNELKSALATIAESDNGAAAFDALNVAEVVLEKAVANYRHRSKKKVADFEKRKSECDENDANDIYEFVRFPKDFVIEICTACLLAKR